ncbi:MAG: hypothetical protein KJO35_00895, partial [Gammaproteobacteria bacterium]|nr:hypothetical protein [Gammaproteobacteria bacterium]
MSELPLFESSELAQLTGMGWDEFLDRSRTVLEQLSNEFAAGDAKVAPKYGNETCHGCHLDTLCRIREKQIA